MWDQNQSETEHLSHDRPCPECGHAGHYYLPCDHDCGCSVNARARADLVPARVRR